MPARIMIVEDEITVAFDLRNRLESLGHTAVGHVTSGEAALQEVGQVQPDLVLMDIRLAGEMDGIETAEAICSQRDLPIVFLTAYADDERLSRARLVLPYGYLLKPIEDRELKVTIEIALYVHEVNRQRKQAEEALRESERLFRMICEKAPVMISSFDGDGRCLIWNQQCEQVLGWTREELNAMDDPLSVFFPDPEVRKRALEKVKEQDGEFGDVEWEVHTKNGSVAIQKWANIRGHRDEGIGIGYDLTERKRTEEEKLALERQVQHAHKLESLGLLAGGIAHDFNNLLMTILGNAELALGELSPHAPAVDSIQAIEDASKRAAELAREMLAYSGRGSFVVEPIDLGKLVEEIAHLLEVSLSKKVELKYILADNLPAIDGDATQVRQIIMNLLTNAAEAIGDKSGVIAMSTGVTACGRACLEEAVETKLDAGRDEPFHEGDYVYVEVADTGCGMDKATIERMFDPFYTTKFAGRGLGLSATLGIVRGHQGTIKIDSELGKGTTLKVLFPAKALPAAGSLESRRDEGVAKGRQGEGTILVVDDEEKICVVAKKMLGRMGFDALTASDGCEGVEVFREHADEIVCVLLDLTMPNMDGEETLHELRRIRPDVKVLLCSGYNVQRVTQQERVGFIQKPYRMAALREKLSEVLG